MPERFGRRAEKSSPGATRWRRYRLWRSPGYRGFGERWVCSWWLRHQGSVESRVMSRESRVASHESRPATLDSRLSSTLAYYHRARCALRHNGLPRRGSMSPNYPLRIRQLIVLVDGGCEPNIRMTWHAVPS